MIDYMGVHLEKNEDGLIQEHLGYALKRCKLCNKEFIIAKISYSLFDTCGICDKKDKEMAKI